MPTMSDQISAKEPESQSMNGMSPPYFMAINKAIELEVPLLIKSPNSFLKMQLLKQ